ncbi:hypothetical protein B0T21DRAFT_407105 [Apiosordaria backusii]|uniref:Uncharacterized protein n=1 Tax=Apiosordaria backusii TaxID=314023 RepID=A0AA40K796_9PEZI|nr:hypothetical protein B0T21DRAFT_407105 [Apiosordaria backusii]
MKPFFTELLTTKVKETGQVKSIKSLLSTVMDTPLSDIPGVLSNVSQYQIVRDIPEEVVVRFMLGSASIRLMQCHDVDITIRRSYDQSLRAKVSKEQTNMQLGDPPMTPELTQYMMFCLLSKPGADITKLKQVETESTLSSGSSTSQKTSKGPVYSLRLAAQEEYWLHMTPEQRQEARNQSEIVHASPPELLNLVKSNWMPCWNSLARYPDYFRTYALDQLAAENVWESIEEDIFICLDKNNKTIFANVENLSQILFGDHITQVLERCLDLWSFFTPLPAPESSRHAVDGYIRKIHPELDPSEATVETLPNAKMCVAHYGTWASQGDPHVKNIWLTVDSNVLRARKWNTRLSMKLFPDFCLAALGKASQMIRFLVKELDQEYYRDCVEILENIGPRSKIVTTADDDGEKDFLSLFALGINGYTQRHKDRNDIAGGLAGLCTLGRYQGGNLCIPQLNLKVPSRPGACALIRGTDLDHLVSDYSGPRFFIIGTNHESVKRNVWRKLGRLPELTPEQRKEVRQDWNGGDGTENVMEWTCMNEESDDDDDVLWTNKEIHESAVLRDESSSSGSTLH